MVWELIANVAKMLRMSGLIGCIAPGSFADILILNANPLEDVKILDRPEIHLLAVLKEGKVISSRIDGLEKDVD
jgi:imidazolonepropionase-like amidohydrolase